MNYMEFPFETEFLRLTDLQSSKYLKESETGMGYQVLSHKDAKFKNEFLIVTNATYLIGFEDNFNTPILKDFDNISLQMGEFKEPAFKALIDENFNLSLNTKFLAAKNLPLNKQPPYLYITRHGDEFRRLSAFRNDKRIKDDGAILSGTYGTTMTDLTVVPSGIAAVGRYALPNRIAACYVYQIIPEPGTHVYFGTVTPNYGLCGGGVEVFFPNGCGKGSAKLIGTLSEI